MNLDYLNEALDYNKKTGFFVWKKRPLHHFKNEHGMNIWNSRYPNTQAGTVFYAHKHKKYKKVKIVLNNTAYAAHRIAWVMTYGSIQNDLEIDHIDGDATNNSIKNLRLVTHSINHRNRKVQSNNKNGMPGVRKGKNTWSARIKIEGKEKHIGSFKTFKEACDARKKYAIENGFTERHHTK